MHRIELIYNGPDNITCVLKDQQNISTEQDPINNSKVTDSLTSEETPNQSHWNRYKIYNLQQVGEEVLIEEETNGENDSKKIFTLTQKLKIGLPKTLKQRRVTVHVCEKCNKVFSNLYNLKIHLAVHRKKPRINCENCEKTFRTTDSKDHHTDRYHTIYHCVTCNRRYQGSARYDAHIKNHIEPRIYTCQICNNTYKSRTAYGSHMYKHSGMAFECYICKKPISFYPYLKVHIKLHSGVRRFYRCTICNKQFRSNFYRNLHKTTHASEKQCSCDICGERFLNMYEVRKHIKDKHT